MRVTICLVEDTPDLLDNLTHFLEMEQYEVWPCRNGSEAMAQLEKACPQLIITDLLMPGMNGFELIRKIKSMEQLREIPIAIFSAKPFQEYETEISNFTKVARIKKPASLDDILKVINGLLHDDMNERL